MSTQRSLDFKPRPIPEFRFWHIGRQKLYLVNSFDREGNLLRWPGTGATLDEWDQANGDVIDLSDGVLMQSTSALDRQGRVIWEGDILYDTHDCDIVRGRMLHSYEYIAFRDGCLGTLYAEDDDLSALCEYCPVQDGKPLSGLIVGNIYQHRDMLTRHYCFTDDERNAGTPPDNFHFDPESVYTYESKIGQLIQQTGGNVLPSGNVLLTSEQLDELTNCLVNQ